MRNSCMESELPAAQPRHTSHWGRPLASRQWPKAQDTWWQADLSTSRSSLPMELPAFITAPRQDTPAAPRGSVVCPSPATAPGKEWRGEPVPRPLVSAAAAAAGAAGEAASGGGQRGVFPGRAAGQMRAAASWVTLSGYLQGGGSSAKHQCQKCDPLALTSDSHRAHTSFGTEQPPKIPRKEAAAFKAKAHFAEGADNLCKKYFFTFNNN